jgi:GntR family transcriptional regulator
MELGVSRMTLRQALESMQFQGLLQRRPGRGGGTFVAGNAPVLELASMAGLAQQLSGKGATVESRILAAETLLPPGEVRNALGMHEGELAHRLQRLRFADDEPIMIEDAWFPASRLEGFPIQTLTGSVYKALASLGSAPVRKVEELSPSVASSEERELLKVGARHPVLRVVRTTYRSDGQAIEHSHDTYRSDAMRVQVTTVQD